MTVSRMSSGSEDVQMNMSNASGPVPPLTEEEAAELALAREHMIARHKLIEGMIRNNELQLKNEAARGGAEIALRDVAKAGSGPLEQAELETVTAKLRALELEHRRLVAEREWLNASLLEFESGPSKSEHNRAGHA
jgi:hypothetical protein